MGRGRAPCCEKVGLNKGSWTPDEDLRLISYIRKHGHGNWRALPKLAGLLRCGKSCRLRWINYLRPDIKRGNFTKEEEDTIIKLHKLLGNKWSKIASCLPGRTDNEIKNMWNTHLKKRLASEEQKSMMTAKPEDSQSSSSSSTYHSCSDHGESKSSDEEKSTPRLDFTDLSIEMIEIPIEPGMDMWSVQMDDIEGKIISEMHMDPLGSKVSPCSSSSELFEMNGIMGGTDQGEAMKDPSLIPDTVMELGVLNLIQGGGYGSLSAGEEGAMEELTQRNSAELLQEEEAEGEEGKSSEWLEYLEKELGLCGASEDNQESLMRDVADQMDPVSSYFQRDLNSTSPLDPHQLRVS